MATKPSKATVTVEEAINGKEERNPLLDAARRVLLAGIGAVALAQEQRDGRAGVPGRARRESHGRAAAGKRAVATRIP